MNSVSTNFNFTSMNNFLTNQSVFSINYTSSVSSSDPDFTTLTEINGISNFFNEKSLNNNNRSFGELCYTIDLN